MHAVIRTGGKQYRVAAGDILEVEKLDGNVGDTVTLDDILLVSNGDDVVLVGQPTVDNASVTAKITGQHRGKKIHILRYRPKKRIRVRKGHRQYLTRLEIESIRANGEVYEQEVVDEPTIEEPVAAGIISDAEDELDADEFDETYVDDEDMDDEELDDVDDTEDQDDEDMDGVEDDTDDSDSDIESDDATSDVSDDTNEDKTKQE